MHRQKLLIINGGLGGKDGNTFLIFSKQLKIFLAQNNNIKSSVIHLKDFAKKSLSSNLEIKFWKENLNNHDAIFILTGTYWDSWSSYLQRFLEVTTSLECDKCYYGKPVGVLVTMHSVGGKEVLSRLQGVFSTQGYLIPPQSSLVISLASEMALELEKKSKKNNFSGDFWSQSEIPEVLARLMAYTSSTPKAISAWEVDKKDPKRIWAKLLN